MSFSSHFLLSRSDVRHVWSRLDLLAHVIHVVAVAATAVVVLLLTVARLGSTHHHALSFLFTLPDHKFLSKVLILHAEFFSDLDKASQAINVVRRFLMDILINLKGFVEEVHASVARGYHKLPFDFFGLDLESSFEVNDSFFELVLFGMMHAEARDDIDLGWVVSVRFLIIMHSLEFILLLLV